MMKLCSLLHITDEPSGTAGKKLLYHLSLDATFAVICQGLSANSRTAFLEVLSTPLVKEEDISYRREILHDFTKNLDLLDRMAQSLSDFEQSKQAFHELKKEIHARNFGIRSTLGGSRESVREGAEILLRMLDHVKRLREVLDLYPLSSRGLSALARELKQLTCHQEFGHLIAILRRVDQMCLPTSPAITLALNQSGRIVGCHLTEPFLSVSATDTENKTKKRFLLNKPSSRSLDVGDKKEANQNIHLNPPVIHSDCQSKLRAYPYLEMEALLTSLMAGIVDSIGVLYQELRFYFVARAYVAFLQTKKVPYTYPSVGEQSTFQDMWDLRLLTEGVETVVPNDYCPYDQDGALLFGDNGNGKTVFLRSIMSCQLLAQAGLPIPARHGTVKLYVSLQTQFAESEEPSAARQQMGRFEQEVQELHAIIESMPANSLLILNEVFQTTAYAEGAVGLYYILRYLTEKRMDWIAVTHLTDLKQIFRGQGHNQVVMYEMTKEHKALPIDGQ